MEVRFEPLANKGHVLMPLRMSRYEMRRECQEILPGLFLGPFVASKSLDTLQGLGITHMCVDIQHRL